MCFPFQLRLTAQTRLKGKAPSYSTPFRNLHKKLYTTRKYFILFIPIISILFLDIILSSVIRTSYVQRLNVLPKVNHVYVMGNSMFKTGIDFELLNRLLPKKEYVDFEYHRGYYLNLWYLIIKNAILPAKESPKLIVWGFNPPYAQFVRRRWNISDIKKFYNGNDLYYDKKVSSKKISIKDKFIIWLGNKSYLYGERKKIRRTITNYINENAIYFLKSYIPTKRTK